MKDSIEKARAALPESRQEEFDEALQIVALSDVTFMGSEQPEAIWQKIKSKLAGKTALEIIDEGQKIKAEDIMNEQRLEAERVAEEHRLRAERLERERQETISEIKKLCAKLDDENPDLVAKFVVERSRFGQRHFRFGSEPSIELAVRNNTGKAISHASFQAILLTPGREVPWVDSGFSYEISGGLEPGESAIWHLRPNMFGEWSKAPADRTDTIFIVRPVRLKGASGEFLNGESFSEYDEKQLRKLLGSGHYDNEVQINAKLDAREKALLEWREEAIAGGAKVERDELLKMKTAATKAQQSIAKFVVEKSRFYFSEGRFSSDPAIDLTVRNNTGQAVSHIYARGVLYSQGQKTPWIDKEFNCSIEGGMQSGEVHHLELAPNRFDEWGDAPKDITDMVFTVTINRLDGAGGEELFNAEFTEQSAARLSALEKMIEDHGWK